MSTPRNPATRLREIRDANVLTDPAFIRDAHSAQCVIVSADKPLGVLATGDHIEVVAQQFLKATRYAVELLITDGSPVTLWADRRIRAQARFPKDAWLGHNCAATLATHYAYARFVEQLPPAEALTVALDAVAARLAEQLGTNGITPDLPLEEYAPLRSKDFARALAARKHLC